MRLVDWWGRDWWRATSLEMRDWWIGGCPLIYKNSPTNLEPFRQKDWGRDWGKNSGRQPAPFAGRGQSICQAPNPCFLRSVPASSRVLYEHQRFLWDSLERRGVIRQHNVAGKPQVDRAVF